MYAKWLDIIIRKFIPRRIKYPKGSVTPEKRVVNLHPISLKNTESRNGKKQYIIFIIINERISIL